ncbi:MAG: DUF1122 family protein [Terriglobia bacterium]
MSQFPDRLAKLDRKPLGAYILRLADVQPGSKSGWVSFRLVLTSNTAAFAPPVVEGIFSSGGRGVAPWIEVTEYHPRLKSSRGEPTTLDLAAAALELQLFRTLGDLIPPGGHLTLACASPDHEATYRLLLRRVPPLLTPLGHLLFQSGFRSVRFFYLAEGGWEGQQKLWAEKALNPDTQRRWDETTAHELLRFLAEPGNARFAPDCAAAALRVLPAVKPPGELGQRVASLLQECGPRASKDPAGLFDCARRLLASSSTR